MARPRTSRSMAWTPPRWRLTAVEARVARAERTLDALLVYLAVREIVTPRTSRSCISREGRAPMSLRCPQVR